MKPTIGEQISQLQRDKIIYAVESVACTLIALLVIISLIIIGPYLLLPDTTLSILTILMTLLAIGYWIYMGVGNFARLSKIKKLQQSYK